MILGEVLLGYNHADARNNHDDRDAISSAQRDSYRDWDSETRPGTGDLRIPSLRKGSYFRSFSRLGGGPRGHSTPSSRKQWREVADRVSLHVSKFAMLMAGWGGRDRTSECRNQNPLHSRSATCYPARHPQRRIDESDQWGDNTGMFAKQSQSIHTPEPRSAAELTSAD